MGIFELIPDNIPFIGNLDEVGATGLTLICTQIPRIRFYQSFWKKVI
jgi:hypothetical protein